MKLFLKTLINRNRQRIVIHSTAVQFRQGCQHVICLMDVNVTMNINGEKFVAVPNGLGMAVVVCQAIVYAVKKHHFFLTV